MGVFGTWVRYLSGGFVHFRWLRAFQGEEMDAFDLEVERRTLSPVDLEIGFRAHVGEAARVELSAMGLGGLDWG